MKPHPGSAFIHVPLECLTLKAILRACVQEQHDLVLRKHLIVELLPIGCCVVSEAGFLGLFPKPGICLSHEADVRLIAFAGVKGNDLERVLLTTQAKAAKNYMQSDYGDEEPLPQ
jgi:hypothetical protein